MWLVPLDMIDHQHVWLHIYIGCRIRLSILLTSSSLVCTPVDLTGVVSWHNFLNWLGLIHLHKQCWSLNVHICLNMQSCNCVGNMGSHCTSWKRKTWWYSHTFSMLCLEQWSGGTFCLMRNASISSVLFVLKITILAWYSVNWWSWMHNFFLGWGCGIGGGFYK